MKTPARPEPLPTRLVAALGVTQVISWGSLYYAISILAPAMIADGRLSSAVVYGGFSLSLLVAGLAAPTAGRAIDRFGGGLVMGFGSVVAAAALAAMALATSAAAFLAASVVGGLAMSLTLYDAAFAVLVALAGRRGADGIAALTLIAGFASTVFWPLTQALESAIGWRETYGVYALIHLAVCLPIHALALRATPVADRPEAAALPEPDNPPLPGRSRKAALALLMLAFAGNNFVFAALSVHFVPLLTGLGLTVAAAVWIGTLVGPAQVGGRIVTIALGHRLSALATGLWSTALLPLALVALAAGGSLVTAVAFALLYGASNGIVTIARGTLPLALFGRAGFGALLGAIALPALLARAAGPLAFAAVLDVAGTAGGLILGGAAALASFGAMVALALLARRI